MARGNSDKLLIPSGDQGEDAIKRWRVGAYALISEQDAGSVQVSQVIFLSFSGHSVRGKCMELP